MEQLLCVENISKSYSSITVLNNVSFTLSRGEVLCLAGENGAGKSTLIKILSGAEVPDCGTIHLNGNSYKRLFPAEAIENGIVTIYQDADLVDTLTVADNIFLNQEIKKHGFIIDKAEQEKITANFLRDLNMKIDAGALVSTLSPGQKQNIQIAKALYKKADILILDEPTASLGEEETEALVKLVKDLRASGLGIIYISHYLDEIFELGDRVFVLKDGNHVVTRNISETDPDQLVRDMVGRDASAMYKREGFYSKGDNALVAEHLTRGKMVKDISFSASHGEIFGIGGLVGSGRTETVRLIAGLDKAEAGKVSLNGQNISCKNPKEALTKGISYITEDRKGEGLFLPRSSRENIGFIENNTKAIKLDLNKEIKDVDSMIAELNIKVFNREQTVITLSGGNQQKVAVARYLLADSEVFIFDEPSKGVDVGAREEIYRIIEGLAKKGKIVILVSSTMTELISLCDRIMVMREGNEVAIVDRPDFSEDHLLKLYIEE